MPAYRHETYDYGPTFTLADLIAEPARVRAAALAGQGRIGAEAERTRGELGARAARDIGMIGAQKWSTLGQLAGNTLQNIGQYYADKPRREAEARRAEYEQLELTEKKRQTGMQEAVRMILSAPGMMVQDQQTGVKMFDKGKLSQELQAARLDPSVIAEALKTAEALDGHAAKFVADRRDGIAGFAFEVLQAGSTPASVLGAVKSGVENGLFTQRDVQPFLKQIDEQGPEAIFPIMRRLTVGSVYEEQASKILSPADARSKRTKEQLDLMKAESELRPKEPGTVVMETTLGGVPGHEVVPDVAGTFRPSPPPKPQMLGGMNALYAGIDPEAIADAIERGDQSPILTDLGRPVQAAVSSAAAKRGLNLSQLQSEWKAVQRFYASKQSTQQLRIRQSIDVIMQSMDEVDRLAAEWDASGFKGLNKVTMLTAKQGMLGPKATSIATQLDAQITESIEAMANVFMGGNSPTERAMELAERQLQGNWSREVLRDMTELARRNTRFRLNAIENIGPSGVRAESPYLLRSDPGTFQVGQIVNYNGQQVEITKLYPDGTFDYKPVR